jgi:hypothetical protein
MSDLKRQHQLKIASHIRGSIAAGVSMRVIFDEIQKYDDAPQSMQTFYKVYRGDIAESRGNMHQLVGNKILEKALEGDTKMLELVARSKMGWSPLTTVNENDITDEADENTTAVEELATLLGKSR